jgi:hypothetical protein
LVDLAQGLRLNTHRKNGAWAGEDMTVSVTDMIGATWRLEDAIREVIADPQVFFNETKFMKEKAKVLPHLLVQRYPHLSDIENELRGVFETCRLAIDHKSISPVVVKAAIAIADEYREIIIKLKH